MSANRALFDTIQLFGRPAQQRQIVFYSEGRAYWPHLEPILTAFLAQSDLAVCYVSSGKEDPGLQLSHPNLKHFHMDEGWVRNYFFENLDTKIMVMTMPDLHQYQVKRSKHPVHYVYVHHSLVSHHMVYRPGAFDHFDTIFCAGPHHVAEMQAHIKAKNLQKKNLLEHGYGRLDAIYSATQPTQQAKISSQHHVLVAPSWGPNGLIEQHGIVLTQYLLEAGFKVTLRPHPQTRKFAAKTLNTIQSKWSNHPNFTIELDVSTQDSLHQSDIMISDWSGAAFDYAFGLEKPVLFVDTARKVQNPEYTQLELDPIEVKLRETLGGVICPDQLHTIGPQLETILKKPRAEDHLRALRSKWVFNLGKSGTVGAKHLLSILKKDIQHG